MKRFAFPLDRVIEWRRTEARIEESKLERLHTELRAIDVRRAALEQERRISEQATLSAGAITGYELAALDTFQRFTVAERGRLERARIPFQDRATKQIEAVTAKHREVRLLERLREQRLKAWTIEQDREIEAQAGEAYLAKWHR